MNPYEIGILSIFDMAMMLMVIYGIFKPYNTKKLVNILLIVTGTISMSIVNFIFINSIFSNIVSTGVMFVILYFYFRRNLQFRFILIVSALCLIHLTLVVTQIISVIIITLIVKGIEFNFHNGLIAQSIALLLNWILYKWGVFSRLNVYFQKKSIPFMIVIINLFVIYYAITMLWFLGTENIVQEIIGIMVIIVITMFVNVVFLRESILNKAYCEKLEVFEIYLPIIDNLIDELKAKQHDFDNHIQTMIALRKNISNELEVQINKYIEDSYQNIAYRDLIKLENKIVLALFYSKYLDAKSKGVNLKFFITNLTINSEYTNYEIVEMYGIILDNAIEATVKSYKSEIKVLVDNKGSKNSLKVINPSKYIQNDELRNFFEKGYTTKNEKNHGIGLSKLRKLIDAKNGTIIFDYDTASSVVIVEILHS